MQTTERNIGYDVLRSIAVWIVLIIHIVAVFCSAKIIRIIWAPLPDGVDLFFVLSGYLIGRILINNFVLKDSYNKKDILKFLIQRWFRTLPNYYFLTFIIIGLTVLVSGFVFFPVRNLFFLQNITSTKFHFYPETWSICVEEWFYMLFPLCIFLVYLSGRRRLTKHNFIAIAIGIIVITFIVRFFYSKHYIHIHAADWFKYREITFIRLDAIAFGTVAAYISVFYTNFWIRYRNIMFYAGLGLLAINTLFIFMFLNGFMQPHSLFLSNYNFPLNSFAILLLLPKIESIKIENKYLVSIFTYTSKISYSIYLIQLSLVLKIAVTVFIGLKLDVYSIKHMGSFLVIYIFAVYLLSALNYRYFELYFMKLREKIVQKYFS